MIGYFGPVKFETSDKRIVTFSNLNRSSTSRVSTHDNIGRKPTSEFLGPNLDAVTFTVSLNATQGVNPRKMAENFLIMNRSGEVHPLVIGGKGLGIDKWIITSVSQAWDTVFNRGQLYSCKVDLTLQEYITAIPPAVKPISKKPTSVNTGKKKGMGKASVKVGMLNLRKGPGTKYPIIRTLKKGETYFVYAVKNGWYDLGAGQWASNVGNKYMTFKAN